MEQIRERRLKNSYSLSRLYNINIEAQNSFEIEVLIGKDFLVR